LEEDWGRAHNVNPYMAASVTGWARALLHKKIRQTSAAYCDTDSVIYLHKPGVHPDKWDDEGAGIGCWGDELEDGVKGTLFMALAPKCYCLVFDKPNQAGQKYMLKSKGVAMSHENHAIINPETYESMLVQGTLCLETYEDEPPEPTAAHTWRALLNHTRKEFPYLATITETGWKNVRPVFHKRELLRLQVGFGTPPPRAEDFACIVTLPLGYEHRSGVPEQDIFYPDLTESL
jgi:hypothetical protein